MAQRKSEDYKITDPAEMLVREQPPLTRHPGVFIREVLLAPYKISIVALADRLGVARPNLSNVLHGKADVSREMAYRFGALLGDQVADFLIAYQSSWDIQKDRELREALKRKIEPLKLAKEAA